MKSDRVVVIGAGIGGLTAGALLASRGAEVTVVERRDKAGGVCTHHATDDGFCFDIASSLFYGFGDAGFNTMARVFEELGASLPTQACDPSFSFVVEGEHLPVRRELGAWLDVLSAAFPTLAYGLRRWYDELRRLFANILQVGFYPIADASLLELARMAFGNPTILVRYMPILGTTVWRHLLPFLAEGSPRERLRFQRLLDADLLFASCSTSETLPLLHAVPILLDRHVGGVRYPIRGGSAAVADALVAALRAHGGRLRLGAEVSAIECDGGRARGVTLSSGERLEADVVVCNASIWHLLHLLDKNDLPRRQARKIEALVPSSSARVACLAVPAEGTEEPVDKHTVYVPSLDEDLKPREVCIVYAPSVVDASLAPEGQHAITLVQLTPWTTSDAADEEGLQQLLDEARRHLPATIESGEVRAYYGPSRFAEEFARPFGAVGGPALQLGQALHHRAGNLTPVAGLALVGDSTYPGEGVVAVTTSALICANQIRPRPSSVARK